MKTLLVRIGNLGLMILQFQLLLTVNTDVEVLPSSSCKVKLTQREAQDNGKSWINLSNSSWLI